MKNQILSFVLASTNPSSLDTVSTKEVGNKFGITTAEAYRYLQALHEAKEIQKLTPVNGDNLQCCDWMKVSEEDGWANV